MTGPGSGGRRYKGSEGCGEHGISKLRLERQVGTSLRIFISNLKVAAKYMCV